MLHTKEDVMLMDDYNTPGFNEQYEELQKNLVFIPSNTILWYACNICNRKSATEERLAKHIEQKHSKHPTSNVVATPAAVSVQQQGDEPFKCLVCPFACNTNADLMRHSKKHKGLKPYSCKVCGKTFSQKGNLKPHMLRHTGESPFQCQLCSKAFNHKTSFKKHMEEHNNPKNFSCRFCTKYSFSTPEERNNHEQTKHTQEDVDCIICGVILNSALGLKMHISQMHPDFPGASEFSAEKKWACQYCNKKFSTKAYLIVHHKIHRGEKPFKCDLCAYRAVSRDSVKKHSERAHGQMKLLECNLCSKKFTYYSHKKAHMLRHYNLKPFSCTLCKRSFLLKRHLTDHMRMHRGESNFKCEKCDVSYVLPDSLRKHKDLHLSSPITCHICRSEFWITGRYNKHMMMHRRKYDGQDFPVSKPFKCHLCSKSFKVKRFLNKHLMNGCTANDDGRLECTECGEVVATELLMKKHMKALHNLKEYSCYVCAEAFKRIQQLVDHVNKNHPEEPDKNTEIQLKIQQDNVAKLKSSFTDKQTKSSESNDEEKSGITLVPFKDTEIANNVLVIDENDIGPDVHSIKVEASEVTYECYSCGQVYWNYDDLVHHQDTHEDDLLVSVKLVKEETDVINIQSQDDINDLLDIDIEKIRKLEREGDSEEEKLEEEEVEVDEEVADGDEVITCYECSECGLRYQTFKECETHYNALHANKKSVKSKSDKMTT